MKQKLCILVLLINNIIPVWACTVFGDSPRNYMYYQVSDSYGIPYFYFQQPDYKQQNLALWRQMGGDEANWQMQDIENVVYNYNIDDMHYLLKYSHTNPDKAKNNFAEWLCNYTPAIRLLLIAKQVEYARSEYQDPWYYPASPNNDFATFERIMVEIDTLEQQINRYTHPVPQLLHRLMLQRVRVMFTLGQYSDLIILWENDINKWDENDLMRTMIKDYIAGAYLRIGDTSHAWQMYLEQSNLRALADLTWTPECGYAKVIRALYDYQPDCAEFVAPILQCELKELGQYYIDEERSIAKAKQYYSLMQYIIRTHHSKDMAIWYYTTAYLEDFLGMPERAAQTIRHAAQCKTTEFMQTNIRYMRIYLDAKTRPYNAAYEQQLFADLCWIDEQIKQNLPEIKANWDRHSREWEIWDNVSDPICGMSDKGHNLYYPNTMLRKIVLGEVAPRMKQVGNQSLALALTNYADNLLFTLVDPEKRHCFFNNFFMAMDTISAAAVERYVKRALNPSTPFERFLATGSYLDKDYLYDIVGTLYLRESQYKKAMEVLSKVSPTYQLQLNTHNNLCAHDPFGVSTNSRPTSTVDCKYNFASEMYSLQQVFQNVQIDPNRRANAMLNYAIGYKNSFFITWGLTQYGQGYPVFVDAYKPWMTKERKQDIKQQYKKLYYEALSLYTDDEALAATHLRYQNNYTIVTSFPNTAAAHFVRSHCDTYYDYHPETTITTRVCP